MHQPEGQNPTNLSEVQQSAENESCNSSFVDATQQQLVVDKQAGNMDLVIHSNSNIPIDTIQKDVEFLKQSWANMAELEQDQINELHKDDEIEAIEPPFQNSVSKHQKKKLKQQSKQTGSHNTRAKVGTRSSSCS